MGGKDIVIAADDELPPPANMKVVVAGDGELPPALKKKEQTSVSPEVSTNVAEPVAEPLQESGAKVELPPITLGDESKGYVPAQDNLTQKVVADVQSPLLDKLKGRTVLKYAAEKSRELFSETANAHEEKNKLEHLADFPQWQKLNELDKSIQGADNEEAKNKLIAQRNELLNQPLRDGYTPPSSNDQPVNLFADAPSEAPTKQNLTKSFESAIKEHTNESLKDVKTVGDAINFYNNTANKFTEANNKAIEHQKDIAEVQAPLLKHYDYKLNDKGVIELNAFSSLTNGFANSLHSMANGVDFLSASPEQRQKMLDEDLGRQVVLPTKPASVIGEGAQMVGGMLPYFVPGVGLEAAGVTGTSALIGSSLTTALMMGGSSGYDNALQTYQEVLNKTGDKAQATEAASSMFDKTGAVGAGTGLLLTGAGALGNNLSKSILGKDLAMEIEANGYKNVGLADYLKYNGIHNIPQSILFPVQKLADNVIGKAQGLDRQASDGLVESAVSAYAAGFAMNTLAFGWGKMKPKEQEVLTDGISKYAPDQAMLTLADASANKKINPQTANEIIKAIKDKSQAFKDVEHLNLSAEQEHLVVPKLVEINNLIDQSKKGNPALEMAAKPQIEGLTREVYEIIGTPLSEKEQKDYDALNAIKKDAEDKLDPNEKSRLKHYETRIETDAAWDVKKDKKIEKIQRKAGLATEPEVVLSDEANRIQKQIDETGTASNEEIKTLSNELYKASRALNKTRDNANRRFSKAQIDAKVTDLEGKVETLETALSKQGNADEPVKIDLGGSKKEPITETATDAETPKPEPTVEPVVETTPNDKPAENKPVKTGAGEKEESIPDFTKRYIEAQKNGKPLSSPEDLQFYENNKDAVEKELKAQSEPVVDGEKPVEEKPMLTKKQLSEDRKKLLQKEPTSLREAILQWFVGGGKVNTDDVKRYLGTKAKGDWQDVIGKHKNGGNKNSIDLIAKQFEGKFAGHDEQDIINTIMDILPTRKTEMEKELRGNKEHEDYLSEHGVGKAEHERLSAQQAEDENAIGDEPAHENAPVVLDAVDKLELDEKDIQSLNKFLSTFTDQDGNVDWGKVKESAADVFNDAYGQLTEKAAKKLDKIIADGNETGNIERKNISENNGVVETTEKPKDQPATDTKPTTERTTGNEVKGKDKIARGVDKLADILGAKKNIIGDEQRPALIDALRDIGEGLIEAGHATAQNVVEKICAYVKDKISDEDFEDVKRDLEKKFEGRKTSAKNAYTDAELEELGLSPRVLPEIKANQSTWDKAKSDVDSGKVDPMDIAEKALDEDAPFLSDEQVFALKYQKAKLLKDHDATYDKMQGAKANDDADLENLYLQHLAKLNGDFDTVAKALGNAGTTTGRALQARGRETDMDYNLLAVNQRMREANGGNPILETTQKKIEELVAKNKEAEEKLKAHEERIAELEKGKVIQDEINAQLIEQAAKSKTKYTDKAKDVADKFRKLKGKPLTFKGADGRDIEVHKLSLWDDAIEIGAKAIEVTGKIADGVNAVINHLSEQDWYKNLSQADRDAVNKQIDEHFSDIKETKSDTERLKEKIEKGGDLKKMKYALKKRQEELVEQGMKNHEDVTKTITGELNGMGMKVDEREVRDVLSGYGEVRKPSQEELTKDIREQTARMRLASGLEDVMSGQPPKKSGFQFDKPNPELDAIKREIKKLIKDKGLDEGGKSEKEMWATAIETWRKRKATEIEQKKETLEKMKRGEIPSPKQKIVPKTLEDIKLQSEAQKYKHLIDVEKHKIELANRGKVEKVLDWIPKSKRLSILLGYKVLGKLAAAGAWQNGIFTPARKLIQTGLGFIPGISSIAEKAPTEGRLSPTALSKNYSQWWQKAAWADVYNTLKTGKSEIDQINRQFHGDKDLGDHSWTDFVMNSHAAIKNLPKRSEYFSSVQSASEWAVKNGMDLKAPETQKMIQDLAYNNAVRNIFMNKNRVTDAYKMGIGYLENNGGIGGKVAASLLKLDMPIVQVPTNIANDVASYTAGLAKAAWTVGYHGKGKAENLTPQQADHVMRSLGKQAVGAIGMGMAYALYKNFGGFYHQGKKEDKAGPKDEQIMVGNSKNGLRISQVFLHHPGFVASMLAADIKHQIEDAKAHHKVISLPEAMWNSVGRVALTIPLLESPAQTAKALENSGSASKAAAQAVAGYIPQVVKEIAKDTDTDKNGNAIPRKPETFAEQLKVNVPGLREQVRSKVQEIMEKRSKPTVHKPAEERKLLHEAKIETEKQLKEEAGALGIKYVHPKR